MKHQIVLALALWAFLGLTEVHSYKVSTQDVRRRLQRIKAKAASNPMDRSLDWLSSLTDWIDEAEDDMTSFNESLTEIGDEINDIASEIADIEGGDADLIANVSANSENLENYQSIVFGVVSKVVAALKEYQDGAPPTQGPTTEGPTDGPTTEAPTEPPPSTPPSCDPSWVDEGNCDDICNTAEYDYDGGDCCLDVINDTYCDVCECLNPEVTTEADNQSTPSGGTGTGTASTGTGTGTTGSPGTTTD